MRRVIASLAFLAFLPLQALACDLRIEGRPLAVAPYVERAQPCLAQPPGGFAFEEDLEARFLDLVNEARADADLPPLTMRRELTDAARLHSLDMAVNGFFGHVGPDGRGPGDRIAALDRTALADFTAENVATVSRIGGIGANFAVRRLHRNLMDSPGHRENILHDKATHVAFGVVRTEEGVWVTQLFMRVSGTLPRAAPLRVSSARALQGRPVGLDGWRFVRYDFVAPSGDPFPGAGEAMPGLDARLAAYATQPGDDPRSYYWMRFPGPAVTITP